MKKLHLIFLTLFAFLLVNVTAQTVTICDGKYAKKYHATANCSGLNNCKGGVSSVSINEAINIGRTPCLICKPPSSPTSGGSSNTIQQNNTPQYQPPPPPPPQEKQQVSVQCAATTKAGNRCKRMTKSSNGYCWQHGG
ncbi:MAG TPA: hypothetical protein VI757_15840 [Bacteroidia bacterium]|nr:hypothetical protein [Bacteroidia bacterium]